jgi:hypothetical protein
MVLEATLCSKDLVSFSIFTDFSYLPGATREWHHRVFSPVAIEKVRHSKGHLITEQKLTSKVQSEAEK